MKALIIGYGSIGQRHTRLLTEMGIEVFIVSKSPSQNANFFTELSIALQVNKYDYAIIANETFAHAKVLKELVDSGFKEVILVEKPLFSKKEFLIPNENKVFVAYNFRFHPLIIYLKKMIMDEQVISVNAYAGQYLPSWRPSSDYTKGYSASREKGGGVLRDLSHELDYLMLLFGEWEVVNATTKKISNLDIQSEDYVQISYITKQNTHISVELNYIDRISQRYLIVHTIDKTMKIDFINNSINCNGEITQLNKIDRDYTYIKQHQAVLNGSSLCCSFSEGIRVVKMIEAVEKSSLLKEWIHND